MTPEEAPPGVEIKWLPRPSGAAWADWLKQHPAPMTVMESRPIIQPRLILVHTNGASGQGNRTSAYNWSMAAPNNTKPHYQVDMDGTATKFLPSNRKAIGNGSVPSLTNGKMAADFSLVIETADPGWGAGKPGPTAGFSTAQATMLEQIIAYECSLWHIPVAYPDSWDGEGVACHTEPFGYPYWTIDKGHVCPGIQKKIEMREMVLPHVAMLLGHPIPNPTPNPSEEDDMIDTTRLVRQKGYANVFLVDVNSAMPVSAELMASYPDVPKVFQDHQPSFNVILKRAWMAVEDLTPGGPPDRF